MESKGKVPKTIRCPLCGKDAVLSHWVVPKGLDPNLRRYECRRKKCGTVVYMVPVQEDGLVTQGPDIFHPGEVIA